MTAQRLAVVDDHVLFAETLVVALVNVGFDARCVVPTPAAPTGASLTDAVLDVRPDVVLLDLDLGGAGDGLGLVAHLSARSVVVVVVTGTSDPVLIGRALAAGATTVMSKSLPFEKILATLMRLRDGLPAMTGQERERLLSRWRKEVEFDRQVKARFDLLTTREAQVLGQLMAGRQVSAIARRSFVSEATVRTQVKSVLSKLQVNSQLTAVGLAHRVRWRAPGDSPSGVWSGTLPDFPPPRATA
jgi:two-component system nitrate/nitrite response regulator NarL